MPDDQSPFPVVAFRGYDRAPVDARLRQLEQSLADARAQVELLDARAIQCAGELAEAQPPGPRGGASQLRRASGRASSASCGRRRSSRPTSSRVRRPRPRRSSSAPGAAAEELRARAEHEVAELASRRRGARPRRCGPPRRPTPRVPSSTPDVAPRRRSVPRSARPHGSASASAAEESERRADLGASSATLRATAERSHRAARRDRAGGRGVRARPTADGGGGARGRRPVREELRASADTETTDLRQRGRGGSAALRTRRRAVTRARLRAGGARPEAAALRARARGARRARSRPAGRRPPPPSARHGRRGGRDARQPRLRHRGRPRETRGHCATDSTDGAVGRRAACQADGA